MKRSICTVLPSKKIWILHHRTKSIPQISVDVTFLCSTRISDSEEDWCRMVASNKQGSPMLSTYLVSDINTNTRNYKFTSTSGLVPLSSLPVPTPPIPTIVITEGKFSGKSFIRRGKCQHIFSDSRPISSLSINGRSHQGSFFGANRQKSVH